MLKIKRATITDLSTIQQLGYELLEYERSQWDDTLDPDWPFSDAGRKNYLDAIENRYAIIAFFDDQPIGYLIGAVHTPPAGAARKIITANLANIYVKPEYRKQGIGNELMQTFREYCREHQVSKINVTVNAENKSAINFYKQQNFSPSRIILSQSL